MWQGVNQFDEESWRGGDVCRSRRKVWSIHLGDVCEHLVVPLLVIREKKGWNGPYRFILNSGALSLVIDTKNRQHTCSVTKINPYPAISPLEDLSCEIQSFIIKVCKNYDPRFTKSQKNGYDSILRNECFKPVLHSFILLNGKKLKTVCQRYQRLWLIIRNTKIKVDPPRIQRQRKQFIVNEAPVLMRLSLWIILFLSLSFFNNVLQKRPTFNPNLFHGQYSLTRRKRRPLIQINVRYRLPCLNMALPNPEHFGDNRMPPYTERIYKWPFRLLIRACTAKKNKDELIGITLLVTDHTASTALENLPLSKPKLRPVS